MHLRTKITGAVRAAWVAIAPGRRAWQGASLGLAILLLWITLWTGRDALAPTGWLSYLLGVGGLLLLAGLASGLVLGLLRWLLANVPAHYAWLLLATIGLLALPFGNFTPAGSIITITTFCLIASALGAAGWILLHGGWRSLTPTHRAIWLLGLVVGGGGLAAGLPWLLVSGGPAAPAGSVTTPPGLAPLALPNPAGPGSYLVKTLTYGSGTDRHRPEYGPEASLITTTVNGDPFLSGWSALRTAYWGFDEQALPRNGRVWYPAGDGPFPLVLMVHGNHNMADGSDPGYAYLGELLASRGFIAVSIDQNFLNGSIIGNAFSFEPLQQENDARAWLLLEHLHQWQAWQQTPGNPFYQQVDMANIGLVGHSRGGEAAAIAATFNRLPYYPDNARIRLDYQFSIRAVAAIAPTDGQYNPAGRPNPLANVSYLTLHGSHDMDVTSFAGANQYTRTSFTDGRPDWFKASLYIYGANHGQFNTGWGSYDVPPPGGNLYNTGQLLPAEAQRQVAQVYLSAFLETMLRQGTDYRPLFRDFRTGLAWLPDTVYVNNYADPGDRYVATFEEDLDVTTTTLPAGQLQSAFLTRWREQRQGSKRGLRENGVVNLGWDAARANGQPAYAVRLPAGALALTASDALIFALADNRDPAGAATTPTDLTLELVDGAGALAQLPLSTVGALPPRLAAQLTRLPFAQEVELSEPVLQHYAFPLAWFVMANPAFDPAGITTIRFVFDRTPAGEILLDDIGFNQPQTQPRPP